MTPDEEAAVGDALGLISAMLAELADWVVTLPDVKPPPALIRCIDTAHGAMQAIDRDWDAAT